MIKGMPVGRYREEMLLGTGGMAEVWRAKGPRGAVAIKRLLPHAARQPSLAAAFEREGRLLSRLEHPNVIGIHEVLSDEAGTYLVLEYVDGADLRALASGPMPARIALRIVRDLLLALEAVHDLRDDDGRPLGLIHRDLSPANVLLGVDGSVKLTDFGIARALSGSQATTGQNIKGTLAYLPPEQARGAPVDSRADLFAVGALLYEMLAGAPIYDESDPRLALARARAGDVSSLGAIVPDAAIPVVEVVDRALAPVPSERFPSARAMAIDLERAADLATGLATNEELAAWVRSSLSTIREGSATLTGAADTTQVMPRSTRRAPVLLGVGVLLAAGAFWLFRPSKSEPAANEVHEAPAPPSAPALGQPSATPLPPAVASATLATPSTPATSVAPSSSPAPSVIAAAKHADSHGEKGLLDIGSEPAFAYVSIDGVKVGPTPIFGRAVTPGVHKIEVSRDGLGSKTFSLDVPPGARMSRVVKLP
jgi:serine/threonine-protein kinase